MKLALALLPLIAVAMPAWAATSPEKVSTLVVYGNDPCPKGQGDEIVVCARQPESERYRIPRRFRERAYNAARDGSWAGTAKMLDVVTQDSRPGSCSASGSWGQTGCWQQFMAQAQAQRAADAAATAPQ